MNLRQAAQQALEAMERSNNRYQYRTEYMTNAITALRAALAEPEQEPDGISWLKRDGGYFTAPTPRKPLTDEEIFEIYKRVDSMDYLEFSRAIERAHGIGEQHE